MISQFLVYIDLEKFLQKGGDILMAKVYARKEESLDSLIRRFKRKIEKDGTLEDMRKHEFYKSPSIKKREKHEAALKRNAKTARKLEKFNADYKRGK